MLPSQVGSVNVPEVQVTVGPPTRVNPLSHINVQDASCSTVIPVVQSPEDSGLEIADTVH